MGIGSINTLHCSACNVFLDINKQPYINWELHEISEDVWEAFCEPCVTVLELGTGK